MLSIFKSGGEKLDSSTTTVSIVEVKTYPSRLRRRETTSYR